MWNKSFSRIEDQRVFAKGWEDLRVPVTATTRGGSKDPSFAVFKKNTGGTSQGVFVSWFSDTEEQELYFECQLPHSWDLGPISPHVHFVPNKNGTTGKTVQWGLEYTYANVGEIFPVTKTIYTTTIYPTETLVASKHYLAEFPDIADVTEISAMLCCRIFRNVAVANNLAATAGLLEIDFHYLQDGFGSSQEYTK